jgi:hypothetical protein
MYIFFSQTPLLNLFSKKYVLSPANSLDSHFLQYSLITSTEAVLLRLELTDVLNM